MNYVVRRKTPNPRGARYFCNTGPAQGHVDNASRFTEEEANTAHRGLREPHLWEVVTVSEAAAMDGQVAEAFRKEMGSDVRRPRGRVMTMLALSAVAASIVDVPRGRS